MFFCVIQVCDVCIKLSPTIDTSVLAAALPRGALPLLQDLDPQTIGTQLWGAPVTLTPTR